MLVHTHYLFLKKNSVTYCYKVEIDAHSAFNLSEPLMGCKKNTITPINPAEDVFYTNSLKEIIDGDYSIKIKPIVNDEDIYV